MESKNNFTILGPPECRYLAQNDIALLGVSHGFTCKPLDFSKESEEASCLTLCRELGLERLLYPKQKHGTEIVTVECEADLTKSSGPERPEGDAIVAARGVFSGHKRYAIGVRTADCVPILFATERHICAVHAGWRGIAAGIVGKVISALKHDGDHLACVIGPCAGAESYEVERDVIEAIGEGLAVVTRSLGNEKYIISLPETVCKSITAVWNGEISLCVSGICTMRDSRFHSFRRDRDRVGANMAFAVI